MLNSLRNNSMWGTRLKGVLAASVLAGSGAAMAATITLDLCATTGSTTLPAKGVGNTVTTASVPVLGYTGTAVCAANTASVPVGPVIDVNVGDTVQVTLRSALAKSTGLLFQGQALVPDTTGISAGDTKLYTFVAGSPGTYLYEAAPLVGAEYQSAMGLHGALIVRPARPVRTDTGVGVTLASNVVTDLAILATDVGAVVGGPGIPLGTTITAVVPNVSFTMSATATATAAATTVILTLPAIAYDNVATSYDNEAVLVLSEIDTALNTKLDPSTFDMRAFAAKYFLINGQPHPNTTPIPSAAGKKLLLRYVNAGVKHHSMSVLGLRQNFVAKDGGTLPTFRHNVAAETLASGQTGDAIITIPASATTASSFAVYDANLAFNNSDARGIGGMLTFITAGAGTAVAGPVSNAVLLNPSSTNGTVSLALSASISSAASTVAAAEYFIGTKGTDGTGTAMNGTFGSATVAAAATIPASALTGLADGTYTVHVHGKDATSATTVWGAATTASLKLDRLAPTTTIGSSGLSPNPSNGAVTVALTATANDATAGNSNIVAAEYSIDGTAAVAMSVSSAAPTTTVFATIPSGLAPGSHSVTVRSQDAAGNWSASAPVTLTVQSAPPSTTGVSAAKSPNNGTVPLSATQPVVRVSASLASAGSTIAGAEGFICPTAGVTCAAGALGSGFPFVPTDGAWGGAGEAGYADIPLATVAALSNGSHVILVRGKDASGNWGPTSSTTLLVDKTVPTISSATLSASTIVFGAASTTLTISATDVGTSVVGGQYWIDGTTTPPANPTAFTGGSVVINTSALAAGTHTVRVRVQDAATNWSAVTSVTLNVIRAVNDTLTFNANTSATPQQSNQAAPGVLANDQPTGAAGRTATLVSGPVRTSGAGTGTIAVTCGAGPATGVCANGSYRVTLTPASSTSGAVRQVSKRGTYQFTYTETLNGVTTAPATVTITVN